MNFLNASYPIKTDETWNIIDSTKLQQYMDCPRSFFFNYILGWRPDRPNNHLHFGAAVHIALEHLMLNGYSNDNIIDAWMKFNTYYRLEFGEDTDDLFSPKTPDRFLTLINQYCSRYSEDFKKYEVAEINGQKLVEISGIVSLDGYFDLHFKMDTVLRRLNDGKIFSLEHKTKGGPFSRQWRDDFPLGIQVGTYTHALYCLFPPEEVIGVTINGLAFKKTKAHLFEFERLPIWKTQEQMQTWQVNTIRWMQLLESDYEELSQCTDSDDVLTAFPMNPRSCTKYFGCPYHDYCLAWQNPLQQAFQPPFGMKVDFWNPKAEETQINFNLVGDEKSMSGGKEFPWEFEITGGNDA